MILKKCPLSAMQANRSKYICLVRILKLWSGVFFKLSNYKVYYYNINRQMRVIIIETKIEKWDIKKNINSYGLNIKSVSDDFDGLTVILENNELNEYYLSKLTCSDSTKISLWHNLLCNFIDFS